MGFLGETQAPEGLEGGNLASNFQRQWPFRALLAGLGCRKAIFPAISFISAKTATSSFRKTAHLGQSPGIWTARLAKTQDLLQTGGRRR